MHQTHKKRFYVIMYSYVLNLCPLRGGFLYSSENSEAASVLESLEGLF